MGTVPGLIRPALVVLVGPSGAGKSTWAASQYRGAEIVSSDALRSVVGTSPDDLEATKPAFAVLDQIVEARTARGLTTVIDALGLYRTRRRSYLAQARGAGMPAAVVLFDVQPALCRTRNSTRDRPVPAAALTAQLRRAREAARVIWQWSCRRSTTSSPRPARSSASAGARSR